MQLCSSLSILWHCLSLGLEWKLIFSSPVATAEFSKFAGRLSTFTASSFRIWKSSTPHAKSWLIGKDSDAGRDWGQEEKGTTEDEMAGWHHWLDGHESEWTLGVGDGQGGLACCDSWGRKESDMTEWLNWTELNWNEIKFQNTLQKKNKMKQF